MARSDERTRATFLLAGMLVSLGCNCGPGTAQNPDGGAPDSGTTLPPSCTALSNAPMGASFDNGTQCYYFRVRSLNATRIELSLFVQSLGVDAALRIPLAAESGTAGVFSTAVQSSTLGSAGISTVYYGYRAWGPNFTYDPSWTPGSLAGFVTDVDGSGNRFNPNKLLIDPYTHEISHDPLGPGHADSTVYAVGSSNRAKDSAQSASKSVALVESPYDFGTKPGRPR